MTQVLIFNPANSMYYAITGHGVNDHYYWTLDAEKAYDFNTSNDLVDGRTAASIEMQCNDIPATAIIIED